MSEFDIFLAEDKYRKIVRSVNNENYGSQQLFDFVVFFEELFVHDDSLIIESYTAESYELLISLLEHYSPSGKPIELSERILFNVEKIKSHIKTKLNEDKCNELLVEIRKELNGLKEFLDGNKAKATYSSSIAFPLIEKNNKDHTYGVIDTLSIILSPSTTLINDEFSIVPGFPKLEKKIEQQLYNSWNYAKSFLSIENDSKIPKFKVVIVYNKRLGFYTGDSNGVALTIAFISKLSKYLNLSKIIEINNNVIFTGLVDKQGVIGEVSKEVIEKKIKIAFYSKYHCLVIPKNDYLHAEKILAIEKKNYPKREISLVPVNNIGEIISNPEISNLTEINFWNFYQKKLKRNNFNLIIASLFLITFIILLSLSYSISQNNSSIENEDFLVYATAEYGLEKDKITPIKDMGEIFNLRFDSNELDTLKNSKILDYKNIELVENRYGESEKAFRFNGDNSFVELRDKNKLKLEFPISVSMWFKKMDDGFGWLFTNNFDTSYYCGVFLGLIYNNIPTLHYGNGETLGTLSSRKSIYATEIYKKGRWNHIAGIISSYDSLSIYLNSNKVEYYYSGNANQVKYNDGPVYLGKFSNSKIYPTQYFNGDMDDLRVFNRTLTQEEIDLLFHEQ